MDYEREREKESKEIEKKLMHREINAKTLCNNVKHQLFILGNSSAINLQLLSKVQHEDRVEGKERGGKTRDKNGR